MLVIFIAIATIRLLNRRNINPPNPIILLNPLFRFFFRLCFRGW
jgi:hypothetical protein